MGVRNYFSVGKGIGAREEGCGVKTSRDVRDDGTLPVLFLTCCHTQYYDLSMLARCKVSVTIAGCIEEMYHFGFLCPNTGSLSLHLSEAFSL